MVLLGVTHDDTAEVADRLAAKIWTLRIMRDEKSASDLGAGILVVSQFTLYGDARKGRRPTWTAAAPGPVAEPLYDALLRCRCVAWARPWRKGSSAPTWRSPSRTTARRPSSWTSDR